MDRRASELHHLRHNFASIGRRGVAWRSIIGKLLGRILSPQPTDDSMPHLDADPVRQAVKRNRRGTTFAAARERKSARGNAVPLDGGGVNASGRPLASGSSDGGIRWDPSNTKIGWPRMNDDRNQKENALETRGPRERREKDYDPGSGASQRYTERP